MARITRNTDKYIAAMVINKDGTGFDEVKYPTGAMPQLQHIREEVYECVKERAEAEWGNRLFALMWESDIKIKLNPEPQGDAKCWDAESEPPFPEELEEVDAGEGMSSRRTIAEMMGLRKAENQ